MKKKTAIAKLNVAVVLHRRLGPSNALGVYSLYHIMIQIVNIRSMRGKLVQSLAKGKPGKGFPPDLMRRAQQLLVVLDAAVELRDLRSPPGNRLEALSGDRSGYHSIRINRQWRIVFQGSEGGADHVEIVDYH